MDAAVAALSEVEAEFLKRAKDTPEAALAAVSAARAGQDCWPFIGRKRT